MEVSGKANLFGGAAFVGDVDFSQANVTGISSGSSFPGGKGA
jgi:hypothetical protein